MASVLLKSTYFKLLDRIDRIKEDIAQNSKDIGEAASKGDLSENAEYESAKERQSMLFQNLRHWEEYLGARMIEENSIRGNEVVYGTCIRVKNEKNGQEEEFNIVGPVEYELELYPNIMTYTSPLGQSAMNCKVGDRFSFESRKGRSDYTILDIGVIRQES